MYTPKELQPHAPEAYAGKVPVMDSPDLRRVMAIPRRAVTVEGSDFATAIASRVIERFGRGPRKCRCAEILRELGESPRPCLTTPNHVQALALYEMHLAHGMLGPIGVGHGKTVLDLLAPLAVQNVRTAVLLVPSGVVEQLVLEYQLLSEHFRVPYLIVHGKHEQEWAVPDAPVLHVYPYSLLQMASATTWLEQIKPDLIIADECDRLRNADTATTARVLRYFYAHGTTRFCAWSGSMTDAKIADYAHLAALALRQFSPLPIARDVVDDWARCLDARTEDESAAPAGALRLLCADDRETVEHAFSRRLTETQGVIATDAPAIKAKLIVAQRHPPETPRTILDALAHLRQTKERPDGDLLLDALSVVRCARELACGFFYRWTFPRGEPRDTIDAWKNARRSWRQELVRKLAKRDAHLDSPLLCARAAMRWYKERVDADYREIEADDIDADDDERENMEEGEIARLPSWHAKAWPAWRDIRYAVQPVSEPVWVDTFLAEDAARWAWEYRGIVWYDSNALGQKIAEMSNLHLHTGGPDASRLIGAETGDYSIVASINSHGRGRNGLQFKWADQIITQLPSSSAKTEQVLGRLHRIGQRAPVVRTWYYSHTKELQRSLDTLTSRAGYVESTIGASQKFLAGLSG